VNDSATTAPKAAPADADIGALLADICEEASAVIMPFWRAEVAVDHKADSSPVTAADHAAEALILKRLKARFPAMPIIAEEESAKDGPPGSAPTTYFLVDPLDGTKGFLRGTEAFTVNIGLVENGKAVAGAVAAPASGLVWFTSGGQALKRRFGESGGKPIRVREKPAGKGLALLSHTVGEEEANRMAAKYGCANWKGMDSSVKFCLIAEGLADIYPRPGRTMEWDTCAAQAVLEAAGGRVITEAGAPLAYGKAERGFDNPGFLALGG
jgi:3'(2'), 5'-bisphosphate nucleotidase